VIAFVNPLKASVAIDGGVFLLQIIVSILLSAKA
jgi:hypothetical protein